MKVRALGDAGKQRELHPPRGKDVSNPKSAPGKKNRDKNPQKHVFQATERQRSL